MIVDGKWTVTCVCKTLRLNALRSSNQTKRSLSFSYFLIISLLNVPYGSDIIF